MTFFLLTIGFRLIQEQTCLVDGVEKSLEDCRDWCHENFGYRLTGQCSFKNECSCYYRSL